MKLKQKLIIAILVFGTTLFGQFEDPVSISASVDKSARAGEVLNVKVTFTIDDGWYIYGIEEVENGPIPTSVEIEGHAVATQGKLIEPSPIYAYDEGFELDIPHHEHVIDVIVPIKLQKDLQPGTITLTVTATYQSCNNTICYPPIDKSVDFNIDIESGEARPELTSLIEEPIISGSTDRLTDLDSAIKKGFWSFILLAMSMGFISLLTPCVFPMIPITVSFFIQHSETSGQKPIKTATVYALGIITTFTLLGFLLAVFLGASGASQLASNPWVNLFIGALFIFFALSLFGMY